MRESIAPTLDLDAIRAEFLCACERHQIGPIENACACRRNNPRPAIGDLLAELEQTRADLARVEQHAHDAASASARIRIAAEEARDEALAALEAERTDTTRLRAQLTETRHERDDLRRQLDAAQAAPRYAAAGEEACDHPHPVTDVRCQLPARHDVHMRPVPDREGWIATWLGSATRVNAETLARRWHDLREELAPQYGYNLRIGADAWEATPTQYRALLLTLADRVLAQLPELVATQQTADLREVCLNGPLEAKP